MRSPLTTISLLLAVAICSKVQASEWVIDAHMWSQPRHGARVIELEPVRESVRAWMRSPAQRLVIRYPGGEEGTLWAQELRDWFVALGVPSSHVRTVPGFPRADAVAIRLERPQER